MPRSTESCRSSKHTCPSRPSVSTEIRDYRLRVAKRRAKCQPRFPSATTHEMHYLDRIPIVESVHRVSLTVAKNRAIVLDNDEPRIDSERCEQPCDGAMRRHLPGCPVHDQRDHFARRRMRNHMPK